MTEQNKTQYECPRSTFEIHSGTPETGIFVNDGSDIKRVLIHELDEKTHGALFEHYGDLNDLSLHIAKGLQKAKQRVGRY